MTDIFENARIQAMKAVMRPDVDTIIRRIYRWYSREFSTPLHEVIDLPLEDVLTHYFEDQYEKLKPDEQHDLAIKIVETPEEKELREAQEKKSEEELVQMAKADNERIKAKAARAKQMLDSLKEINSIGPEKKKLKPLPPKPKVVLPNFDKNGEAEISISFEEKPQSLDLNGSFGPPPKPRKV